jgi:hypothetical protein
MKKPTKKQIEAATDALISKAIIGLQIPIMQLGAISKRAGELLAIPGEDSTRATLLRAYAMSVGGTESAV